jgi:hypothetical protein
MNGCPHFAHELKCSKETAFQQEPLRGLLDSRAVKVDKSQFREKCEELMILCARQSD